MEKINGGSKQDARKQTKRRKKMRRDKSRHASLVSQEYFYSSQSFSHIHVKDTKENSESKNINLSEETSLWKLNFFAKDL